MLNKKILSVIERKISSLMFEDAYYAVIEIGIDECWDKWNNRFCYKEPMKMYSFLMYCISREERAVFHFYIFQLLIFIKPFFDDPYVLAYWHIKQALKMEPENIDIMRWILKVFEPYPERLIADVELLDLADKILSVIPDDEKALEVKNTYKVQ